MSKSAAYGKLLVGIAAISFSAIFVKLAGTHPTVSAFYRCVYSSLILLAIAGLRPQAEFKPNNLKWIGPSLGAGLFLAADLILWHKSILYIGAGPATLLGNSQVVFVALFGYFFLREKMSAWFWALVPLIFLGLYLAIPKTQILIKPQLGLLMGLAVGMTYAGFLICLHRAKKVTPEAYPEVLSLAITMGFTAMIIGGYGWGVERVIFWVSSWQAQVYLFLMALIPQSIGWILIKTTITRIPSHQGSLLLILQPILTLVWGGMLFQEPFGLVQALGVSLALGLIVVYQLYLAPAQSETEI